MDPAIKCITGCADKDQAQSLQVLTGQIRVNSSGALKSEFRVNEGVRGMILCSLTIRTEQVA